MRSGVKLYEKIQHILYNNLYSNSTYMLNIDKKRSYNIPPPLFTEMHHTLDIKEFEKIISENVLFF